MGAGTRAGRGAVAGVRCIEAATPRVAATPTAEYVQSTWHPRSRDTSRGLSTRHPRRRRNPASDYPRGTHGVAATKHEAPAASPRPGLGPNTRHPRRRRDPASD